MGDARKDALRVEFDNRIKLEFHGAAVTSDAGLVAYRELDEALGLTEMGEVFRDSRRGKNTQHEIVGLLRQSVYSRLAAGPAMRQAIGGWTRDQPSSFDRSDGLSPTSCSNSLGNFLRRLVLPHPMKSRR